MKGNMQKKKKHNYVTLIWEEVPENIKIFIIPRSNIDEDDKLMLRACHNNYINSSSMDTSRAPEEFVDKSLSRLSDMLADPKGNWVDESYVEMRASELNITKSEFIKFFGKWQKYMIETSAPYTLPRSKLYRSGFMM